MNTLPQGFFVDELYCLPLGTAGDGNFAVIPGPPAIDIGEGGVGPSLLASPGGAALALGCAWFAGKQDLAAVRAAVARRYPQLGAIRLASAAISDVTATLTVHPGAGKDYTAGPQPASGLPANRAVFNTALTAAEKAAALGAFRGEAGLLTLRYKGTLVLDEQATVEITGDLAPAIRSLAPAKKSGWFGKKPDSAPPTAAACSAALDAALAAGQLVAVERSTPNAAPELAAQARSALLATLVQTMLDKLTRMGADAVSLTALQVTLSQNSPGRAAFPLECSADLGAWFALHGGEQWISHIEHTLPEPQR